MTAKSESEPRPMKTFPSTLAIHEDGPPPLSRKVKLLTAGSIFCGNMTFGCAVTTYGPAMTSFQMKYDTDGETISLLFSISVGGVLLGALSSGLLFKLINRQLGVVAFLAGMAGMMFLTPYCPTLTSFFIVTGVMGIFCGFYTSAQFVWMMEMMQKECPPYVQGQHFFYAFGTILSTLITAPFLSKEPEMKSAIDFELNSTKNDRGPHYKTEDEMDKLFIPYMVIGGLLLVAVFWQLILFLCFRYRPPPQELKDKKTDSNQNGETPAPIPPPKNSTWRKIRLVFLSCCFFGAWQGMEISVIQFLPRFAQNSDLHLSESDSAYILAGLTAAYAAARFVCIFIVFKVPSKVLLWANVVITIIANILLMGWASSSLPLLWTSSILFGLGFSSAFACYSAFIERFLQVTDGIGALIMVCGSGVAAGYPFIIGSFIDKNPIVLAYTGFISLGVCTFAFGTTSFITNRDKTRY